MTIGLTEITSGDTLRIESHGERDRKRRKKKKSARLSVRASFEDLYKLTGKSLGEGSYGRVKTCVNIFTGLEYAVKIIEKIPGLFSRSKILKEIEIYHLCRGQQNIIQLIEYFEETDVFYLVFEKINGGSLLEHIQRRIFFTEAEASKIIIDLTEAVKHLHDRGIAHRDIKPDNVLCLNANSPCPVKLCDFDLCSQPVSMGGSITPLLMTPVGSLEYMAPEVVDTFIYDDVDEDEDDNALTYNKKCDLWSLGVIMYILLCGYPPCSGHCGSDCGWDEGESCQECQEQLFNNIKEREVIFPVQHWASVSREAKDLIERLLAKESTSRFDADQVLSHPWITNGRNSNNLETSRNLQRQTSIKDLEDFANRVMAVNRAVTEESISVSSTPAIPIPVTKEPSSFALSPPSMSRCGLLQRRRRSKENAIRFASIEEMDADMVMRTFC